MRMRDPFLELSWFPNSQSPYLVHAHEIVISTVLYTILHLKIAPWVNRQLFGKRYSQLRDKGSKLDFDVHVVSMVQSLISIWMLLPIIGASTSADPNTYQDDRALMVTAISAGYFIWDIVVCTMNFKLYGLQFWGHAAAALYVMLITMRPFCQNWVGRYLLFEASTPFVNINWYIMQLTVRAKKHGFEPVNMPSWINTINAMLLFIVFFLVRVVFGTLNNIVLYYRLWSYRATLPGFPTSMVVLLNLVLTSLNYVWFSRMVNILAKLIKSSGN